MDAVHVTLLREVLAGTEWLEATRAFAGALRGSVSRAPRPHGGLLLVGTETYEPWHLAAHLDDEAAWCGLPELSPVLVRCRVPDPAPDHLSVGLARLAAARRGETVLVVAPERTGASLLERVHDARRTGATVLAMEGGDAELCSLAHDTLHVPGTLPPDPQFRRGATGGGSGSSGGDGGGTGGPEFDVLQHLVSAAAGEDLPRLSGRRGRFRDRLSRLAEQLTSPPPTRW